MTTEPPTAVRLVSGVVGLVAIAALIDKLGNYYWFQPYDRYVFGTSLFIGLIWYVICGPKLMVWAKEEEAKLDREDDAGQ